MIPEVFFSSECGTLFQGVCSVMGRVPGLLKKLVATMRIDHGVWVFVLVFELFFVLFF